MTMLSGYCWEDGRLCYKPEALKAFGLLKVEEEDDTTSIALRKLHWFKVPTEELVVIGSVADQRVQPGRERSCSGVVSFFDRSLGGGGLLEGRDGLRFIRVKITNSTSPSLQNLDAAELEPRN